MRRLLPETLASLALVGLILVACGGQTSGGAGGGCVTVDLTTYDQSCHQASDCATITAGQMCSGGCRCGGATINVSGLPRYEAAVSGLGGQTCDCVEEPLPQCIAGSCTLCSGPNPPAGCNTVGVTDAGVTPPSDAGKCIDVDLATYDRSCKQDTDCTEITAGNLCSNACLCGGSAINVDGSVRYAAAISNLALGLACPCPYLGAPRCIQQTCTICFPGPNGAPGCPDGG